MLDGVTIVPMNLPDEMTSKSVSHVAELYASSPLRGFLCKQVPKVSFRCSTGSGDSEGGFDFWERRWVGEDPVCSSGIV